MPLFTCGYEGLSLGAFIETLNGAGVRTVFDVRQRPLSRKPGFSKLRFAEALQKAGCRYVHASAFGCPKPVRERFKRDAHWPTYVESFLGHLSGQEQAIIELAALSRKTSVCLVCFEADFEHCHRSLVARAVARVGGPPVVHLTITGAVPDAVRRAAA